MSCTPRGRAVGVILAGGKSRRMGRDKNFVKLPFGDGRALLQWAADRLSAVCETWVVADAGRELLAGAVSVEDGPGAGPVAGLLGAAEHLPGRPLLTLACDQPFVPAAFLQHLSQQSGDWVVPITDRGPEPTCAMYRSGTLEYLRRRAAQGKYSLRDLAEGNPGLDVCRMDSRGWLTNWMEAQRKEGRAASSRSAIDPESALGADALFSNLNRPEDLERARRWIVDAALRQANFLRPDSTRG